MVSSRSQSHHRSHKPILEIIPDSRFIVFHGNEHEASSAKLSGRVRLTTADSISILKPKIRLEGRRKISWAFPGTMTAGEIIDKRIFWNQEQKLGVDTAHKIKAGTIEWPFELQLGSAMPESVEGLGDTFIAYHLHASVSRPGWNAKDVTCQTHIRIVRTLGADSMETSRSRVNADIWANKISYSISIPSDTIVFGTSIVADVELSPLKKGIRLGKVDLRLLETVTKRIQASEVPDLRADRGKTEELEVAKTEMEFPDNCRITYDQETADDPVVADEMYKFQATLALPKSLNSCRQDVDSHSINITHRFKLMVNIQNPEGHVSQLVCRLPVKLFISPNLPVNEQNEVTGVLNEADLNLAETSLIAPPEYGRHQLDQIFRDIDPAGFLTRAGSVVGTPSASWAQSRRASAENIISSLDAMTEANGTEINQSGITAAMLHSRLSDLQDRSQPIIPRNTSVTFAQDTSTGTSPGRGHSMPHSSIGPSRNSSYMSFQSLATSPPGSFPTSNRTSDDLDVSNVTQNDYNLESLSRVPSYNTTVRTPGSGTFSCEGPPSYLDATSRPPSPVPISRPTQSHARSSGSSTPSISPGLTGLSMSPLRELRTARPGMVG